MAARKTGTSPHTRYRHAREHLADLEAQYAKIERSRPRTVGKRGWRTRRLHMLAGQLRSARGMLTKARNAIAQAASERASAKCAAKQRRSDAAKRGWSKRKATREVPVPVPVPAPAQPARAMRFLEERDGEVKQILVDPPSKDDRSAIGSYWHAVGVYRNGGSTALLSRFDGRSIYDARTQRRIRFVTDPALLAEAVAAGLTDFDDLYTEIAWASAA